MVVGNIAKLDKTCIENTEEDHIVEEALMDSLDFMELLVEIEANFGVSIPPTEVTREDMDTPNKIIALIKSKQ